MGLFTHSANRLVHYRIKSDVDAKYEQAFVVDRRYIDVSLRTIRDGCGRKRFEQNVIMFPSFSRMYRGYFDT